ncbi:membrane protein [Brachybacterium phenoliresistens]|uniref:Membrane protein n=1 Tax=Brachybacterium phenoliresistens TaxID=396014 RepID=Z9JTA4_9MICO|nr:DoxX family protein [Brachybacterium phenoliresistens]EWS81585.1 membrane protein [Brachybacterium phenoliresistens]
MAPSTPAGRSALSDLGLLLARVALGVIFAAHGYQKVFQFGMPGVAESFSGMGVPFAQVAAPVVAYAELIGGVLLVLGAFTPIVGLVLTVDMLVAALLVHLPQGLFVDQGGWELVGALGAGALALAAVGAGRYSADATVLGRRRSARGRARSSAAAEV